MGTTRWLVALLLAFYVDDVLTSLVTSVIPVRAEATYRNPKYVDNYEFYVKRYGRKSAYFFSLAGNIRYEFGNNITVHLIFYELLHNEYKRSFVEMHFKLCDMINKDPIIGKTVARTGLTCPVPKGYVGLMNMTVATENVPDVWPFENNKVEVTLQQTPTQDIIARFYLIILVKQRRVGKNK